MKVRNFSKRKNSYACYCRGCKRIAFANHYSIVFGPKWKLLRATVCLGCKAVDPTFYIEGGYLMDSNIPRRYLSYFARIFKDFPKSK